MTESRFSSILKKVYLIFILIFLYLPIGTKFKVEELPSEIPLGYRFEEYQNAGGLGTQNQDELHKDNRHSLV